MRFFTESQIMTPEKISVTKVRIFNPNQRKMAGKKKKTATVGEKKPLSQTVARKKSPIRGRNPDQDLEIRQQQVCVHVSCTSRARFHGRLRLRGPSVSRRYRRQQRGSGGPEQSVMEKMPTSSTRSHDAVFFFVFFLFFFLFKEQTFLQQQQPFLQCLHKSIENTAL